MLKLFRKPDLIRLIIDFCIQFVAIILVLKWFPLTTHSPFVKYKDFIYIYFLAWFLVSYFLDRYNRSLNQTFKKLFIKLFYTAVIVFFALWTGSYFIFNGYYSVNVILTFTIIIFVVNIILYLMYFAIKYAVRYDDFETEEVIERKGIDVKYASDIDDESCDEICSSIRSKSGKNVLGFLSHRFNLKSGNTYVNFSGSYLDLKSKENYKYDVIINLEKLNDIHGINRMLYVLNLKLPDDGRIVCCFEPKSTRKSRILNRFPAGINYLFYFIDFVFKRIMPKLLITHNFYYDIFGTKNRALSKVEVLGRLYLNGFKIIEEKKINQLTYIVAQRIKHPERSVNRYYGPLIKLERFGRNYEKIKVYKFRTMHPYSEYLQSYFYEKNQLQIGGKIYKDFRVTTMGHFMRKYWLDEIPMLINLFKGQIKLVGVRPLSMHFYSLYSEELQQMRAKFKPGLLPPFYVDLPGTLDEIQKSEMKYLIECEKRGSFRTDIKYFFLVLKNIIFGNARSS